jgi:hypothetical protein
MIDHLHWRRSGETKLVIELTFTSDAELSIYWDRILAWHKNGPRALRLSIGKPNSVSMERLKT